MDPFLSPFLLLLVVLFVTRAMNERAIKKLSDDEKARLVDQFSSQRTWSLGLLIVLIAGYYWLTSFSTLSPRMAFGLYFTAVLVLLAFQHRKSLEKLRQIQVSPDYIKYYQLNTTLKAVGLIAFMLIVYFQIV